VTITEPAWLLLLWAGVAATLAAAIVGVPPGATLRQLRLARRRAPRNGRVAPIGTALATLAIGAIVYPVVYGLVFETVARADIGFGAGLGAVHGLLAGGLRLLRPAAGQRAGRLFRLLLARFAYGAMLGFLYAVPAPPA
jgi:hypothetical protein